MHLPHWLEVSAALNHPAAAYSYSRRQAMNGSACNRNHKQYLLFFEVHELFFGHEFMLEIGYSKQLV